MQEDEIDLGFIFKIIWLNRLKILVYQLITAVLSLAIAFNISKEYTTVVKLLPEKGNTSFSGLSGSAGLAGLAGMAGFNLSDLNGSDNTIPPGLYPEMVKSIPVLSEIINDTVYFENQNIHTTSFAYFSELGRKSFMSKVFNTNEADDVYFKAYKNEDSIIRYSKRDWKIMQSFKDRILISIDDLTGLITVEVKMPDPYASAEIAKTVLEKLSKSVIEYKTDKAKVNLAFIEKKYLQSKKNFEELQSIYAHALDKNVSVNSARGQIELSSIEYNYNLAFELFSSLSSEMQQAKIKLNHDTPIVSIIEPARIPEKKSWPKYSIFILLGLFLGTFIGIIVALIGYYKGK